MSTYTQGTPCWVDLGTPDVAAAKAFYGGLFGWTGTDGPPEAGGYVIFNLGDAPVAGVGPLMMEGQPSVWNTYFATDDADATAAKIETADGKALMAVMDVMDIGRMGLFMDNNGAVFGLWQKVTFGGADVVNETGSLIWNELMTRDVEGSTEFYRAVLGVGAKASAIADVPYTEFLVDDRSVAGMMSMDGPNFPPDLPSHWMVYFAVDDCDASAAKVQELGGAVTVPPMEIPVGRFSIVTDPAGAFFAVIKMAPDRGL